MIRDKMRKKEKALRSQATHIDQFGALYKQVNGQMFHFRRYPMYPSHHLPCWATITLPADYKLRPIK